MTRTMTRPMLVATTALIAIGVTWAVEYAIEPGGGFPVTLYLLAGDIFHKLAYAVGAI